MLTFYVLHIYSQNRVYYIVYSVQYVFHIYVCTNNNIFNPYRAKPASTQQQQQRNKFSLRSLPAPHLEIFQV